MTYNTYRVLCKEWPPSPDKFSPFKPFFPAPLEIFDENNQMMSFSESLGFTLTIKFLSKYKENDLKGANRTGREAVFYLTPCTLEF